MPQIRDECGGVSSLHLCAALPCPFPSRKPNSARIRKRIINEAKQVLILPRVVRRRVLFLAGFSFGPRFRCCCFAALGKDDDEWLTKRRGIPIPSPSSRKQGPGWECCWCRRGLPDLIVPQFLVPFVRSFVLMPSFLPLGLLLHRALLRIEHGESEAQNCANEM